jgi:hypothetical protein
VPVQYFLFENAYKCLFARGISGLFCSVATISLATAHFIPFLIYEFIAEAMLLKHLLLLALPLLTHAILTAVTRFMSKYYG